MQKIGAEDGSWDICPDEDPLEWALQADIEVQRTVVDVRYIHYVKSPD